MNIEQRIDELLELFDIATLNKKFEVAEQLKEELETLLSTMEENCVQVDSKELH